MALQGPIIIVEDDPNDAEIIEAAIKEIGIPNPIKKIYSAQEGYEYLCATNDRPFVILCDIRMPGINGLAFRKRIVETEFLRKKSIPFVFYTGLFSEDIVNEAYDLHVQGFYQKGNNYDEIKDQLLSIFMYWKQCLHPNQPNTKGL